MCFTVQLSRFLSFLRQPYQITIIRKACQELFSFFETFFLKLFPLVSVFFDSQSRLSHLTRLVKNFFQSFLIYFSVLFDSFDRISYILYFVNNFFHFLKIYCCYLMLSSQKFKLSFLSQQQLVQNSTSNIVCQLFFYFFQNLSFRSFIHRTYNHPC